MTVQFISENAEAKAWINEQIQRAVAEAVAPLRAEISLVDDFANGVFAVLLDVLPFLLRQHPELAEKIEPLWHKAVNDFELAKAGRDPDKQTPEFYEARKMLYRIVELMRIWPQPGKN